MASLFICLGEPPMSLLQGTPKEVVLSLINSQNTLPVPLTEQNLYFGAARLDTDGVTSILPVAAMLGEEYAGYASLKYKRINLSQIFDVAPIISDVGGPTLYSMLDAVNKALGLTFTQSDVYDTNIQPINAGEQTNINMIAKPGSAGYVGQFFFRFIRLRITFTDAVKNTSLAVLTYPGHPDLTKTNIAMMLWGYDFSDDVAAGTLRVNWNNTWANQTAVKNFMTEFGITDWPAPQVNGVTDYATKDYPGANTAFQRVIVQKGVSGSTYAGDALFHYNPQ